MRGPSQLLIPGHSTPVRVVNRGEWGNFAELIEISLPFSIQGIDHFETTNGFAYYSNEISSVIIGDGAMIIGIQIAKREVTHSFHTSKSWIFDSGTAETGCCVFLREPGPGVQCYIPWKLLPLQKGFGPVVRDGNRARLPGAPGYERSRADSPPLEISSIKNGDSIIEQTVLGQATLQICQDVALQAATCSEVIKLPDHRPADVDEWVVGISKGDVASVCTSLFTHLRRICLYLKVSEPVGIELPSSDNRVRIEFLCRLHKEFEKLMHHKTVR